MRWGRTSCPSTNGTELIYSGLASASPHNERGGGSNYLCLPSDPEYLETVDAVQESRARLHGVEYQAEPESPALESMLDHNAPCAVCFTPLRGNKLMIPGKLTCPPAWTREYFGYLVAERHNHHRNNFVCLDAEAESVPGSAANIGGALFYFTEVICNGITCPPYVLGHELACVVCTK